MATVAARSVFRSVNTSARCATSRIASGAKPKSAPSPFRIASNKPPSACVFRSPVEMSSVNVMSMLPYHTATASALLTSMLSAAPRSHAWTLEGGLRTGGSDAFLLYFCFWFAILFMNSQLKCLQIMTFPIIFTDPVTK